MRPTRALLVEARIDSLKGSVMNPRIEKEDTARVLATAAVFFGGLAALAAWQGVFERLAAEDVAAIAAFAAAFASLALWLDVPLREYVRRAFAVRKGAAKSPAPKRAAT